MTNTFVKSTQDFSSEILKLKSYAKSYIFVKKATGARLHHVYLIMCIMTATVKDDIIGVLLCFMDQQLILKVQDIVKGFSTILSFGKRQDF